VLPGPTEIAAAIRDMLAGWHRAGPAESLPRSCPSAPAFSCWHPARYE